VSGLKNASREEDSSGADAKKEKDSSPSLKGSFPADIGTSLWWTIIEPGSCGG